MHQYNSWSSTGITAKHFDDIVKLPFSSADHIVGFLCA